MKDCPRQWFKIYVALSKLRWGELPWTLPDEDWTEKELNKRNDEIERRLKNLKSNETY